jgi:hypothetical protein
MTAEGRLARGKENYERKRFLDNPETLEYMATLKPVKEAKDAKPNK